MTIRRRGFFETGVCFAVGLFIMIMGGAYIALTSGIETTAVEILGIPVEAAMLFAFGGVFWLTALAFLPKARAAVARTALSRAPAPRHRRAETTTARRSMASETVSLRVVAN